MSVEILNGSTVTKFIEDTEAFDNCVNERFEMLDVNGDGVLSPCELKEGFGRLLAWEYESQSEEEINNLYNTIFEKFDEDQNGTIDREEFRSLIKDIMLGMAQSIGNSPVQVALEEDSLLMKAVEYENSSKE